jgi:site-specific DNA-methyltransferase (adenine-specific)
MESDIAKLDKARTLLAEVRDAKDAKRVADLAKAVETYARRQRLSEDAIEYATAIKIDAMTLLGEMLRETPKNQGSIPGKTGARGRPVLDPSPKLSDHGISKRESVDAQALANVKKTAPELHAKIRAGKASIAKARIEVKREKKRTEMKQPASNQAVDTGRRIIEGDCLAEMSKFAHASFDLIFADPPYNIGIDYGDGAKADRLPEADFVCWCREWIRLGIEVLKADGSFWLLIGDEYAGNIAVELEAAGLHRRTWIKWYETFGVNCENNFNRCSRHLFYCVKNPRRFTFNPTAILRPSSRQVVFNDGRAVDSGKLWDDVWVIPRLVGTANERIPDFPTQLPLEMMRPIIECSTIRGGIVLDPFSGSATTGVAATQLGRHFVGIEKSRKFAELSRARLDRARFDER